MRRTGRTIGFEPHRGGENGPIHLPATLKVAAIRRQGSGRSGIKIETDDLRFAVQAVPQHRLVVFAVDASDSMGEGTTSTRISVAKGAVMALLNKAYISRDRVSMIIFQDDRARTVLPPTSSIDIARRKLRKLPIGGSTPLSRGLLECWRVIRHERQSDPSGVPLLVLLSDGDANAPINSLLKPDAEVKEVARKIANDNIPAIIIETGSSQKNQLMQDLAEIFHTSCYRSTDLKTSRIIKMVDDAE